jgi:hypothetical protein
MKTYFLSFLFVLVSFVFSTSHSQELEKDFLQKTFLVQGPRTPLFLEFSSLDSQNGTEFVFGSYLYRPEEKLEDKNKITVLVKKEGDKKTISFVTRSKISYNLTESENGYQGAYTRSNGISAQVRLHPYVTGIKTCAAPLYQVKWNKGNIEQMIIFLSFSEACDYQAVYGNSLFSDNLLSPKGFICNPITQGTCIFKKQGKDKIVAWYNNPSGGSNSALFTELTP